MINHVTYHVGPETLEDIHSVMSLLGFREVPADDPFEHGYDVRWFRYGDDPVAVHFVSEGIGSDYLDLGHFCVVVPADVYAAAGESAWCVRNSGSGRIWLKHTNIRIEVRSA